MMNKWIKFVLFNWDEFLLIKLKMCYLKLLIWMNLYDCLWMFYQNGIMIKDVCCAFSWLREKRYKETLSYEISKQKENKKVRIFFGLISLVKFMSSSKFFSSVKNVRFDSFQIIRDCLSKFLGFEFFFFIRECSVECSFLILGYIIFLTFLKKTFFIFDVIKNIF